MAGEILLERSGDRATITLAQPSRRNAMDSCMWSELRDTLGELGSDPPRVLVVTGANGHFSAGMDLQPGHALLDAIRTTAQNKDAQQASEILSDLSATIDLIASFPAPTIAAVEGSCVGAGLEIALACDLRVMARTAVVAFPETRVVFIPDLGGTARAVQRLGAGGAALLILTGRRINADTAHALRLTEALADTGEALAEAYRLADEILAGAPIAIEQALQVLRLAPDLVLADALAVEKEAGVAALLSGECLEGIDAFLERRTPQWEGE